MDVKISYNDHSNIIKIDINKENGYIQEKILGLFNLLIYNIEHTLVHIKNNYFVLGLNELIFTNNLHDFLDKNNFESIDYIEIIDRKRNSNGNVIKENLIIDEFNLWYQQKESNEYIQNYNRINNYNQIPFSTFHFSDPNVNIFINTLNSLNNQSVNNDNINQSVNNENINQSNQEIENEVNNIDTDADTNIDTDADTDADYEANANTNIINNNNLNNESNADEIYNNIRSAMNNFINNITDELNNMNNNELNNNENTFRTSMNNFINELNNNNNIINSNNSNDFNQFFNNINNIQYRINPLNNSSNNIINNTLNNSSNNIINNTLNNSSNNIINNQINNLINNQYFPISNYNHFYQNVFNNLNVDNNQNNQTDVIIALTDDEFKEIECIQFKEINHELNEQCNICLECFSDPELIPETDSIHENNFLKLKCDHIFHYECIENWLKNHSNKCPVCRIEIAKGHPMNL